MDKKSFNCIAKQNKPKGNLIKDLLLAFFIGGIIAIIYQGISDLLINFGEYEESDANMLSSMSLIFVVGILTYFGIYSKMGQMFGGGLFIPISGFANSMISSSIEGREEGLILGIGCRLFDLAGSAIAYGIVSGVCVSIIRAIILLFMKG